MPAARLFAPVLVAAAVSLPTAATAIPLLIDFEALAHGVDVVFVPTYVEDGFVFTSNIDPDRANEAFAAWGPESDNWTGSAALFNTFDGFVTTLAREDGTAFDLTSIDLAPAFVDGGSGATITFIGTTSGGGTVVANAVFSPDLTPSTTYMFAPEFTDLVAVRWEQGEIPHQFDNLRVDAGGTPVIPEPATAAMLLAGLGLLGSLVARRRRTSNRGA